MHCFHMHCCRMKRFVNLVRHKHCPFTCSSPRHARAVATCLRACRLLCINELQDELSCCICLEICARPCTTPCGEPVTIMALMQSGCCRHAMFPLIKANS